jgi:hypothetical protein
VVGAEQTATIVQSLPHLTFRLVQSAETEQDFPEFNPRF